MYKNYDNYTDEEIIELIRKDDKSDDEAIIYLINKYKNLVKIKARTYFIIGSENEDIIQEGMIGLYKAIKDYENKNASFKTFANLCIERQMMTAIKTANRKKHMPLNSYLSFNMIIDKEKSSDTYFNIFKENKIINPEDIFIAKESVQILSSKINKILSKFEKEVLFLYLKGTSYQIIAKNLNRDEKAIDNAIQRIRKKIASEITK